MSNREPQDPAHQGRQKGAQTHAEGQQGEKTHARFLEQITEQTHEARTPTPKHSGGLQHHRLDDPSRIQSDEADLRAEKNRRRDR